MKFEISEETLERVNQYIITSTPGVTVMHISQLQSELRSLRPVVPVQRQVPETMGKGLAEKNKVKEDKSKDTKKAKDKK